MSTLNNTGLSSTAKSVALAATLSAALLAGCTTLSVRSDYDSKVSMNVCKTYAWTDRGPGAVRDVKAFDNPLNNKRLRDAVQANLSERGLTMVQDRGAADCMVAYAIGTRQRVDVDNGYPHFGWGLGMGWGGRRGFGSLGFDDDVYAYREGRISVDIFNARSNDPIWHASVDEDVTYLTGSDAEARISSAVKAVFTKYPAASTT